MPEFLLLQWLGKPVWMWVAFLSLIVILLAFDLGVLNREDKELGVTRSLWLSVLYIAVATVFGACLWWAFERGLIATEDGSHAGISYFTGFFIEKSLSIDNVFVISLIFGYFAIPRKYQYRALIWGIIGVIVLRGVMIAAGAALVHEYAWILYVFGAFLILTGLRMLFVPKSNPDLENNLLVRTLCKYMRTTHRQHENHFFVRAPHPKTGKPVIWATPLLLALMVINIADLIFAIDSVPAIFAITTDTFVVYTANIMAILGLRALYFALAAMVHRFYHLTYALALVLIFIGGKIFWNQIVGKVDPTVSLGVTVALILGGILYSLWKTRSERVAAEEH